MIGLRYDKLKAISETVKPYRKSTNRFPIANRKHSHKYFLVDTLDGETVFCVIYGKRWIRHEANTGEAQAAALAAGHTLHDREYLNPNSGKFWHEVKPNQLGIVRPDDTFEFTVEYIGQGNAMFLSDHSSGFFFHQAGRGGLLYGSLSRGVIRPIFKGLRIKTDMSQVHESTKYEVIGRKVNRKKAKDAMAQYSDMFKTAHAMFSCMDSESILLTARELIGKYIKNESMESSFRYAQLRMMRLKFEDEEFFTALVKSSPLDAFFIIAIGYSIGGFNSYHIENGRLVVSDLKGLIQSAKRILNKHIYPRAEGVLEEVRYTSEDLFPQSKWQIDVRVNNVNMTRY